MHDQQYRSLRTSPPNEEKEARKLIDVVVDVCSNILKIEKNMLIAIQNCLAMQPENRTKSATLSLQELEATMRSWISDSQQKLAAHPARVTKAADDLQNVLAKKERATTEKDRAKKDVDEIGKKLKKLQKRLNLADSEAESRRGRCSLRLSAAESALAEFRERFGILVGELRKERKVKNTKKDPFGGPAGASRAAEKPKRKSSPRSISSFDLRLEASVSHPPAQASAKAAKAASAKPFPKAVGTAMASFKAPPKHLSKKPATVSAAAKASAKGVKKDKLPGKQPIKRETLLPADGDSDLDMGGSPISSSSAAKRRRIDPGAAGAGPEVQGLPPVAVAPPPPGFRRCGKCGALKPWAGGSFTKHTKICM